MRQTRRRSYVSLREQRRSDNGKSSFVVTWTPSPGDGRRLTFSDATLANLEADRIEQHMRLRCEQITKIPRDRLVVLNGLMLQFPHVAPHDVYEFYFQHHRNGVGKEITVRDAGKAFIESRQDREKFSDRQRKDVRQHINRLIDFCGNLPARQVNIDDLNRYLKEQVGGAPKTRWNHVTTIKCFGKWMRANKKWL